MKRAPRPAQTNLEVANAQLTTAQLNAFIEMSKMGHAVNLTPQKWMQVLEAARAFLASQE